MNRYRMLQDSKLEPKATAGTTVYACVKCDYGLSGHDTVMAGKPHISVTLNADGGYPFFTVPVEDIEAADEGASK